MRGRILKVVAAFLWPFILVVGVYLWLQPQQTDMEAEERKQLLSDTAKVNAAHRTYENVRLQQMLDDPDAVKLAKKVLEIKGEVPDSTE